MAFLGLECGFLPLEAGFGRAGEVLGVFCLFFFLYSSGSAPEQGDLMNLMLGSRKAAHPKLAEFWGAASYPVHSGKILGAFFGAGQNSSQAWTLFLLPRDF